MRVVVIGSGAQGTGMAGLLAMEKDIDEIILADYSEKALEKAKILIESLGNRKLNEVCYKTVHADDINDIARVIHGSDICFHAILPKFNLPIMKACLKEHVNYLDLIALPAEGPGVSWDETIGAQLELFDAFKKENLIAIPSVGISPGWTLYAAADMIKEFDEVKEVVIRWSDWLDTEVLTSSINPAFMLSEWFGGPHPSAWKNGEVVAEDLIDSEEEFEFPQPIGMRKIYTCTSQPDIMMIPMFSPKKIPYCVEKGGPNLGKMDPLHIWIKAIQKATAAQGTLVENINMIQEFGKMIIPPTEQDKMFNEGTIRNQATCFSVEVNGYKDGKFRKHIQYNNCTLETARKHLPWGTPAVYDTIGGLPIILILMIGRGEIRQRGVFSIGQLGMGERLKKELIERDQDITEKIL